MAGERISVLYDRQCPVCESYCRLSERAKAPAEIRLVDARDSGELLEQVTAAGLDIDQGMVVEADGELYYGADAIHWLAVNGRRSGWFNQLAALLFGTPARARLLYPLMRTSRNLLLKLLRRTKINNLELPDNARF